MVFIDDECDDKGVDTKTKAEANAPDVTYAVRFLIFADHFVVHFITLRYVMFA
jgi:hypothetical protein